MTLESHQVLPRGIRLIAYATGIRWIGWGMCEALIPVIAFSITGTYAGAGILAGISNTIFFVFFIPVGILFDRADIRKVLIAGLLLFMISSTGYFFAGMTRLAYFFVIAEIATAFAILIDVIGRSAYIRKTALFGGMSSAYGFSEAVNNLGTITGVTIGIFLSRFVDPYFLFLEVPPTTLVTAWIFYALLPPHQQMVAPTVTTNIPILQRCRRYLVEAIGAIKNWNIQTRALLLLLLLCSSLLSIGMFIFPIHFFAEGAGTDKVFLAFGLSALPFVFSTYLGSFADRWKHRALLVGLASSALTLFILSFVSSVAAQLICIFLLSLALILTQLTIEGLVTRGIKPDEYGLLSSFVENMKALGPLVGPISIGFLVTTLGMPLSFQLLGGVVMVVLISAGYFCLQKPNL